MVISSAAAVSGPTPTPLEERGGVRVESLGETGVEVIDPLGQVGDPVGEQAKCVRGGSGHVLVVACELGADADQPDRAQPAWGLAQRRVGGDHQGLELVDRLGAGLHGGGLRELDHLDRSGAGLGNGGGPPGQHRDGRAFGVEEGPSCRGVGGGPCRAG